MAFFLKLSTIELDLPKTEEQSDRIILGKLQEVVDIGEIRCQPHRNAERPLLAAVNDVAELLMGHAPLVPEDRGQILTRQTQSDLAYARITETPAAHRELIRLASSWMV